MNELIRAGGLYGGPEMPIPERPVGPLRAAILARPACATFHDAELVVIRGSYAADMVLCLHKGDDPDDEMEIQPAELAAIVSGLDRGEILAIHGFTRHAPEAAFFKHIEPQPGGGQA